MSCFLNLFLCLCLWLCADAAASPTQAEFDKLLETIVQPTSQEKLFIDESTGKTALIEIVGIPINHKIWTQENIEALKSAYHGGPEKMAVPSDYRKRMIVTKLVDLGAADYAIKTDYLTEAKRQFKNWTGPGKNIPMTLNPEVQALTKVAVGLPDAVEFLMGIRQSMGLGGLQALCRLRSQFPEGFTPEMTKDLLNTVLLRLRAEEARRGDGFKSIGALLEIQHFLQEFKKANSACTEMLEKLLDAKRSQ